MESVGKIFLILRLKFWFKTITSSIQNLPVPIVAMHHLFNLTFFYSIKFINIIFYITAPSVPNTKSLPMPC